MGRKTKDIRWDVKENGCWICTSHFTTIKGYPIIHRKGFSRNMCRYIYACFHGEIQKGMQVLHKCDTPSCINPNHLFLGTNADNVKDKTSKNRQSHLPGEKHPMAKLTEPQVLQIINNKTAKCRDLAKVFNVHYSTIAYIRKGKLWKYLREGMA